MSIQATRACINAILSGSINSAKMVTDPVFQFQVPVELDGVPANVCNPRESWADKAAYDAQRVHLAGLFKKNYAKYIIPGVTDYSPFGPKI